MLHGWSRIPDKDGLCHDHFRRSVCEPPRRAQVGTLSSKSQALRPSLPRMAALLGPSPSSPVAWPTLTLMEDTSGATDDSSCLTPMALDESALLEAEAECLLSHQEDFQLTLPTPRRGFQGWTKSSTTQTSAWYDESSQNESPCSDASLCSNSCCLTPQLSRICRQSDIDAAESWGSWYQSDSASCSVNEKHNEIGARRDGKSICAKTLKIKTSRPPPTLEQIRPVGRRYCYVLGDVSCSSFDPRLFRVEEIKLRAAALLLTTLRSRFTSTIEFRCVSERLMRLIIEEALVLVPLRREPIVLSNGQHEAGIGVVRPPCAVSMEKEATPMLELFHDMEPQKPTGYVCLDVESDADTLGLSLYDTHLPTRLEHHDVFLLDHSIDSGDQLCAAIRCLEERGATRSKVVVASLIASAEAIQELHAQFPGIKLIMAQIVSDGVRSSSGHDPGSNNCSQLSCMRRRLQQAYQNIAS